MKSVWLSDASAGFVGFVSKLEGESAVVERMAEIGILPGADIYLRSVQAFGEPYVVEINDATFALRRTEARCVLCSNK